MLFNSSEYILAFLPVTVVGFLLLGMASRAWALVWLIAASVFFYAWWRPFNLLIIGPSLVVNYAFACALLGLAGREGRKGLASFVLALGVLFNVCLLGYFKYANFGLTIANDVAGTNFVLEQIILPLGISFITFQKIAFLVDVAGGRVRSFTARDFLLFVMFFPQLIAGPIVHYGETMPQFHRAEPRFDADLFAVGITLFCFGLFKKVVLADGIAEYVSPIFAYAAAGQHVTLLQGWFAAVGFTLQLYFDFSGYTDMACGASLLFGIRLPFNFDSPLKASNIIDFWLRWHLTLTRFLTAYVYNPIALMLTRRRAAKGLPMLGGRDSKAGAFFNVLAWPTLATMLVSGIWHGAGYTFILWGLLHGFYLIVNHAWRQYGPPSAQGGGVSASTETLAEFALTFVAVAFAMVLFRAPDVTTAINMMKGMVGLHGLSLPAKFAGLAHMPGLAPMMLLDGPVDPKTFAMAAVYLAGLLMIALFMPNSLQVMSKYQPVLQTPKGNPMIGLFRPNSQPLLQTPPEFAGFGPIYWHPTLPWMTFIAALGATSMIRLSGPSEFLYWQF